MPIVRVRKNARHAKPSKAAPVIAAAGISASFVAADAAVLASSASAATSDDFARLRQCESGGNYSINTGNGFYGAYQFDRGTWNGLGYSGRADQAPPATQDAAAAQLQSQRGWSPWPACSRSLGLGRSSSDGDASRTETRASRSRAQSVAAPHHTAKTHHVANVHRATRKVRVAVAPTTPPVFAHKALSVADRDQFRIGVHMWQARMAARGWDITVDGYFGPQSSRIAKQFAAEKRLHLTVLPGEVDKGVWDAAWRLPVG